mgnify:CR=1 FL=1
MNDKSVLLFVSFWISLFILFVGISNSILCLECLGLFDRSLVVLLCVLSSFEGGKSLVIWCEDLDK